LEFSFTTDYALKKLEEYVDEHKQVKPIMNVEWFYGSKIRNIKDILIERYANKHSIDQDEVLKLIENGSIYETNLLESDFDSHKTSSAAFSFWTDRIYTANCFTAIERHMWDLPPRGDLLEQWATVHPFKVPDGMSLFWSKVWKMGFGHNHVQDGKAFSYWDVVDRQYALARYYGLLSTDSYY
jgi:hypothetical protein